MGTSRSGTRAESRILSAQLRTTDAKGTGHNGEKRGYLHRSDSCSARSGLPRSLQPLPGTQKNAANPLSTGGRARMTNSGSDVMPLVAVRQGMDSVALRPEKKATLPKNVLRI